MLSIQSIFLWLLLYLDLFHFYGTKNICHKSNEANELLQLFAKKLLNESRSPWIFQVLQHLHTLSHTEMFGSLRMIYRFNLKRKKRTKNLFVPFLHVLNTAIIMVYFHLLFPKWTGNSEQPYISISAKQQRIIIK